MTESCFNVNTPIQTYTHTYIQYIILRHPIKWTYCRFSLSKLVLTWIVLQHLVGAYVPHLDRIVRAGGCNTCPTGVEVHVVCIARMQNEQQYGKIN